MRLSSPFLGAVAIFLGIATANLSYAATTNANSCLTQATDQRTTDLKTAYNDYSKQMTTIADRLKKDEADALKLSDDTQKRIQLQRARGNYATDLNQATQTLQYKLQQVWMNYVLKAQSCGGDTPIVPTYYNPYSYGSSWYGGYYGNYGGYGYGYGGYPYSGWYGSQAPYGYSSVRFYQPYGAYNVNPYYYPDGNNYNGNYGYYNLYGQGYCPQVVMTTLPKGCGYECRRDDKGCQTCEVSCRNVDTNNRPNCICPQVYSPVCGKDGRTYTNSCYALCADTGLAYGGTCN